MKKRTPFTFEEHVENGKKIKDIYEFSVHLFVRTANKYGTSSIEAKKAERLCKAVSELKNVLDNAVCSENPDKPDKDVVSVYYGNTHQNNIIKSEN